MVAHVYSVLDSYFHGFALRRAGLPFETSEEAVTVAESIPRQIPTDAYHHLAERTVQHILQPGYDYAHECEVGLDVIVAGLERIRGTG